MEGDPDHSVILLRELNGDDERVDEYYIVPLSLLEKLKSADLRSDEARVLLNLFGKRIRPDLCIEFSNI